MGIERFDQAVVTNLQDAQRYMCTLVEQMAKAKRDSVIAAFSAGEMTSWPIKRDEAKAYDGTDASAPMLAIEAQARLITTAALVAKVSAKAAALSQLEAQIAGVSGRHCDAIKALQTFDAVADYDYSGGWPV